MFLSAQEIARVVKDEQWQDIRMSMKGETTQEKLKICLDWIRSATAASRQDREMQVMNYLNALARGGQIAPIPNKTQKVEVLCQTVRIRK